MINFQLNSQLMNIKFKSGFVLLSFVFLSACAGIGSKTKVESPTPPTAAQTPDSESKKPGGYYLDDGPGEDAPTDIDAIPDAQLSIETPLERANKPYSALGMQYKPMTVYTPYKKQGMASWYGKRYHGKQTSSGEVYDMYSMTAAHTTLPIPSYARVTNPANGRSIIVRINDRGPFKHDRLIDLSYAAAYKLRLAEQGSALVEVELLDTSSSQSITKALQKPVPKVTASAQATPDNKPATSPVVSTPAKAPVEPPPAQTTPIEVEPVVSAEPVEKMPVEKPVANSTPTKPVAPAVTTPPASVATAAPKTKKANSSALQYFVQAGVFKSEANSQALKKKIQASAVGKSASVDSVYNDGLYIVKLGPYSSRKEADTVVQNVRKQLGISAIVKN